ncbi:MAG TPA: GDSL-type esterase/lipase family protein [Flavisolibacter sp.]|jgi:hypothetical protein|nr:GDSL-type esterase/lipase family protein [Flavisolibacter sp.]
MIRIPAFLIALLMLQACASGPDTKPLVRLSYKELRPIGRFLYEGNSLELISSACHFGYSFEGRSCEISARITDPSGHNYLQYELDGVYQKRIRIDGNRQGPIILTAENAGLHTIWIYKATEAHTGPIYIDSVKGTNIKSSLLPVKQLIEFIGNSITCGAASDPSEIPCGTGVYHDQHNAYAAYGPRLGRMLDVNYIISGVSGIGIYRNWNSERPVMPDVYEKADFQENGRLWDFRRYHPAIVSIALGTNDFSLGDGLHNRARFDSAAFVSKYIVFIQLIRSKYPQAQIALLNSPMVSGPNAALLERCLKAVKAHVDLNDPAGRKTALFFFKPMKPHGCSGHPSVEDHEVMANELAPFFRSLMTPTQ